jgi:hypothetical protein
VESVRIKDSSVTTLDWSYSGHSLMICCDNEQVYLWQDPERSELCSLSASSVSAVSVKHLVEFVVSPPSQALSLPLDLTRF